MLGRRWSPPCPSWAWAGKTRCEEQAQHHSGWRGCGGSQSPAVWVIHASGRGSEVLVLGPTWLLLSRAFPCCFFHWICCNGISCNRCCLVRLLQELLKPRCSQPCPRPGWGHQTPPVPWRQVDFFHHMLHLLSVCIFTLSCLLLKGCIHSWPRSLNILCGDTWTPLGMEQYLQHSAVAGAMHWLGWAGTLWNTGSGLCLWGIHHIIRHFKDCVTRGLVGSHCWVLCLRGNRIGIGEAIRLGIIMFWISPSLLAQE